MRIVLSASHLWLIVLRSGQNQLTTVKIIATAPAASLKQSRINFDSCFQKESSNRNGIPNYKGTGSFEFQIQFNEGRLTILYGQAPYSIQLQAHA